MNPQSPLATNSTLVTHRIARWWKLLKLRRELREGEQFEQLCRDTACRHLAELEQLHNEQLRKQIAEL